jgi:hypothetical protein
MSLLLALQGGAPPVTDAELLAQLGEIAEEAALAGDIGSFDASLIEDAAAAVADQPDQSLDDVTLEAIEQDGVSEAAAAEDDFLAVTDTVASDAADTTDEGQIDASIEDAAAPAVEDEITAALSLGEIEDTEDTDDTVGLVEAVITEDATEERFGDADIVKRRRRSDDAHYERIAAERVRRRAQSERSFEAAFEAARAELSGEDEKPVTAPVSAKPAKPKKWASLTDLGRVYADLVPDSPVDPLAAARALEAATAPLTQGYAGPALVASTDPAIAAAAQAAAAEAELATMAARAVALRRKRDEDAVIALLLAA